MCTYGAIVPPNGLENPYSRLCFQQNSGSSYATWTECHKPHIAPDEDWGVVLCMLAHWNDLTLTRKLTIHNPQSTMVEKTIRPFTTVKDDQIFFTENIFKWLVPTTFDWHYQSSQSYCILDCIMKYTSIRYTDKILYQYKMVLI